jgi:NAD(P)-dependent dehydrogenase (short-subunit alcohol dehydrogenase family)
MSLSADLGGVVALVTGASSGIGAHAAAALARSGARVVLGARRLDRLAANAAAIEAAGGRAHATVLDVTDEASIDAAFAAAEAAFGPVSILVNNAGIGIPEPALDQPREHWESTFATNLTAPWLVARAFARRAIAAGSGGSVINMASIAGLRPALGLAAYGASKAGLIHLTQTLALEWVRYGIRVNAIAPGYIRTDMNDAFFSTPAGDAVIARIPQKRLGRLDDLDGMLVLLASDASSFITGVTIPIDGGHLLANL